MNSSGSTTTSDNIKKSIKAEIIYGPSKAVQLKSRGDYVRYSYRQGADEGYSVMQDVKIVFQKKLSLYGRMIFFKTDSFKSAVYEYENDPDGIVSSVPLFGNGLRWYFMCVYRGFAGFAFSVKYSETYKPDEKSLGSGYAEIPGNIDNNITFQADIVLP
jgi:hypothetical protein